MLNAPRRPANREEITDNRRYSPPHAGVVALGQVASNAAWSAMNATRQQAAIRVQATVRGRQTRQRLKQAPAIVGTPARVYDMA